MALGEGGSDKIDLLQYNVQDRIDYYTQEQIRMRNGECMEDDAAFFYDNCKDVSRDLSIKFIDEASKAARMSYPYTNKKQMNVRDLDSFEHISEKWRRKWKLAKWDSWKLKMAGSEKRSQIVSSTYPGKVLLLRSF